ncbi:hypothetical protein Tco_0276281 [Tanacetum coccineum]
MLAIDGVGFDWSDMAEEQVQTNMALMAFSDSEVYNDKTCTKTCLKNYETLKKQCDDLIVKLNQTEFTATTYKRDPEFKSYGSKDSKLESNIVCDTKSDDSKEISDDSLVKEQVSDDTSSFVESPLNVVKETVLLVDKKIEFVKPKNHENLVKKSVKYAEMYRSQSPRGNQRNWNGQKSNQLRSYFVMYNKGCFICGSFDHVQINCNYHQRERMVSRNNYNRVDYNYYAKTTHPSAHRNMTPRAVLLKTVLTPLNTVRPVNTAYPKPAVINKVLVVKPHNKTPYELFRGLNPSLSFMRPFGCHVTILNTLDNLGKFDGKSDEVVSGTISNESAGTQGELNAGTSTQKKEISQDCIVMPIWNDALYFDSPSKDVGNGEPKSASDDQKQVEDGSHNESDEKDKSKDDSSPKEVNVVGQHVNTDSPEVNTGHFKLNTVDPSVNTASSNDQDSPKDMFKLGASHTLKATHVEFFSDEDEPEVTRKEDGIFNSQDKYVAEILKKFNYTDVKSASTLVDLEKPLVKDVDADDVDVHLYKSMIGSLMYLIASRPDIMFAVCACARFQVTPKPSHLLAIKRIFRYLKAKSTLGLWPVKRGRDTKIPQSSGPPVKVSDEAVHKELGDRMERATTTASSLEAEQDSATARTTDDGEVEITASIDGQVKTITDASLRRHLKLEDSDGITSLPNTEIFEQLALVRDITKQDYEIPQSQFPTQTQVADEAAFTSVDVDAGGAATTNIGLETGQGSGTMHKTPTRPHDSPLLRVHTLGSDEGSLQQNELMDLVTKLTDRVEVLENDLQQTKKVYSSALTKTHLKKNEDAKEDSSKQGRKISEIDKDPTISLVHPEQDIEYDFDVSTAEGFTTANVPVTTAGIKISTANISVSTASVTPEVSTAAENLVYIRRSAEKRKDKGKAIMKEDESIQKKSKKQLEDAKIAKQLQEEFDRARQEQEVVAKADQAHDIDSSDPVILRYHAVQNRSFSKAEEVMKRPGFDFQQKSSKKRSREDSDEDNAKKQKLEDDAEKKELRDSMDVVPRDDIIIDVESLSTKYPIVDWKTHVLTENMMYYQIIRADGSSKNYKVFSEMLNDFDRQDVIDLYRLVQERYDTTSPGGYDLLLWGDLKILFEPNEEDEIWKNQPE